MDTAGGGSGAGPRRVRRALARPTPARRARIRLRAAALAVVLAVAGCGGEATAPTPAPTLAGFDPPLAFGAGISLGDGYQADAYHVAGGTLHTYQRSSSELVEWDLASGASRGSVTVDLAGGLPREGSDGAPYGFTDIAGRVALLVAFEFFDAGVGTRESAHYLRVRAYYADDGSLAWSQDLPEGDRAEARILAISADHTVLVTGARQPAPERQDPARLDAVTTVLDTATGTVRKVWTPFVAYALDRDVVAGLHPDPAAGGTEPAHVLEGRHVLTGETVWEQPDPVTAADYFGRDLGAGVLLQPARSRGSADTLAGTRDTNQLLEVATGNLLAEIDHDGAAVACHHDGDRIVVCGPDPVDRSPPVLAAYDLHARTRLWHWDDVGAGRELPTAVTAVHRGVVYMEYDAGRRQPVALDARTGEDLAVDLPVAPDQVGPGYGLTFQNPGGITIHPATA